MSKTDHRVASVCVFVSFGLYEQALMQTKIYGSFDNLFSLDIFSDTNPYVSPTGNFEFPIAEAILYSMTAEVQ